MAIPVAPDPSDYGPELDRHREDVLAMLRGAFPRLEEYDDIYQDACAAAIVQLRRGEVIDDLRAFLRRVAWRRARAIARRRKRLTVVPVDPVGALLTSRPADGPAPEDYLQTKVDAAVVHHVLEQMDRREADVIKLRFDVGLSSKQIEQVLGISSKQLEKLMTAAYKSIERELWRDSSGEIPWTRRQRSLLVACLTGVATEEQVDRARRIISEDPACRALLLQIRAALDRIAIALPMPVVLETHREPVVAVLDRLNESSATLREALTSGASRAGGHASSLEPVTGSIISIGTAGAAKVALICLSLGGGAMVCVERGVFGRDDPAAAARGTRTKPPKEERPAKVKPRPKPRVVKAKPAKVAAAPKQPVVQRPTTNGPAPASPAPPGSEEFGPGSIGSVPASTEPAPAPLDGGGEFTP